MDELFHFIVVHTHVCVCVSNGEGERFIGRATRRQVSVLLVCSLAARLFFFFFLDSCTCFLKSRDLQGASPLAGFVAAVVLWSLDVSL